MVRTTLRPWVMVAAPVAGIVFVAVAWQSASVGASRPPKVVTQTITKTVVVQDTSGIDQLRGQVAALQQAVSATSSSVAAASQSASAASQAVTATVQSMGAQLSTLGSQITGVQHSINSLQTGVSQAQSAAGASSEQAKQLGVSLTAVTQQLQALQAQFVAEVKKLEAKGIG